METPPAARVEAGAARPRRKLGLWLQLIGVLGVVLIGALFLVPRFDLESTLTFLQDLGVLPFYLGFVVLTLLGVPSTPFYLLGGAVFPLWQNLIAVSVAIFAHFAIAWLLSARWMRGYLKRFFERRNIRLPEVRPDNEWRVAILVKIAPGFPMFLKGYILGVAGVSFSTYMWVCWVSTFIFATAFLTMGRSAIEGSTGLLLGGLAVLVVGVIAFRWIRKYLKSRQSEEEDLFGGD